MGDRVSAPGEPHRDEVLSGLVSRLRAFADGLDDRRQDAKTRDDAFHLAGRRSGVLTALTFVEEALRTAQNVGSKEVR